MGFVNVIKQNLINIPGWRTNRKIVVIESDDWGSIRMPSKEILSKLEKKGYIPKNDKYNRFDSLASGDDLTNLFEVLDSVKDKNNNPAILTANTIVANPDFKKIEDSGFKEYYYELFTDTLKNYPEHSNSFSLWKKGIEESVFYPQFHGRDHVNVNYWLKKLNDNDKLATIAFKNKLLGLRDLKNVNSREYYYMRALDYRDKYDLEFKINSIKEGLQIFNSIFGYNSSSFIAPSYVWDDKIEMVLKENNVNYIQGIRYQKKPIIGREKLKNTIHYLGKKNMHKQIYLIRNAFFEPSLVKSNHIVEETLRRIEIAFKWKKPAIIGSHRLNYIGFINKNNRDTNLILLKTLLKRLIKKWPEIEFMTSDELGKLIDNNETSNT